jgi:hypothetical protein
MCRVPLTPAEKNALPICDTSKDTDVACRSA